jgi:kynurenine formamidase
VPLTPQWQELAAKVRNWGRWGDDDERGTQNLIDDEARRRGAATVRMGRALSLAIAIDENVPQKGGAPGRFHPVHSMLSVNATYTGDTDDACFNDDMLVLALAAGTHVDALAHVTYGGQMYNGFPASDVKTPGGATRCGADKLGPIVSRGVLLDLPAVKGVERLEPGYAITEADLDAALDHAEVELVPGDVALVRTGQMQLLHGGDQVAFNHDTPGLSTKTIEWIWRHDLGAVFTDTYVFEVWPPEDWACMMPVHMIHLRDMGLVQGQILDLEALAEACADEGRHELLFTAAPEPVKGGCSAPVNPVAVL